MGSWGHWLIPRVGAGVTMHRFAAALLKANGQRGKEQREKGKR